MPRRTAGFTLLEICLAIMIGLVIVSMAVPSISGLFSGQRLRKTFEEFDDVVRAAQARSLQLQCDHALIWDKDGSITLVATEQVDEPEDGALPSVQWSPGSGQTTALERPAAMEKTPPAEWTFWKSGVCEPAVVVFNGPEGSWTARYDPLTVRGTMIEEVAN